MTGRRKRRRAAVAVVGAVILLALVDEVPQDETAGLMLTLGLVAFGAGALFRHRLQRRRPRRRGGRRPEWRWRFQRRRGRRCAVYYITDPAYGGLVYVGMTNNPRRRMRQHSQKWWWRDTHQVHVEWHPSRKIARDVERAAIRRLRPVANRAA